MKKELLLMIGFSFLICTRERNVESKLNLDTQLTDSKQSLGMRRASLFPDTDS